MAHRCAAAALRKQHGEARQQQCDIHFAACDAAQLPNGS
jgi:hypothetical protein